MEDNKHIAIIGGGVAGMGTASVLLKLGYRITLIEKEPEMGGKLNQWDHLFPDFSNPQAIIGDLKEGIQHPGITILNKTEITEIEKLNGRYRLKAGRDLHLNADAVVIATGFRLFDATYKEEYGYGLFENVITSADFESILRNGKKLTTSQGTVPKRIAIIHCVGSRDAKSGNNYCSKVCCITGVKQAIEINRMLPECEVFCFYMDLRLYGSSFDELYLSAQKEHKIQFIRGRLSEASERQDKSLQIKAEDTLSGRPLRMNVDMIILLVGMEPAALHESFKRDNLVQLDENGFIKSADEHCRRSITTQKGIFASGTSLCPMSVSDTFENAMATAIEVDTYLKSNGNE
jgi:heterodisulfide reductase subunit A